MKSEDDKLSKALKEAEKKSINFDIHTKPRNKINIEKLNRSAKKIRDSVVEYHEELVAV